MIRPGFSVARLRLACPTSRRQIGTAVRLVASGSRTHEKVRNSGALITGAALAAATATIYAFNSVQIVHNEDPAAAPTNGSTNTAPLKLEDDGKLHTYVWGSNK